MPALKNALLGLAVLATAACSTQAGDEPEVVTEGKAVYVLNVATEQQARPSAVRTCRAQGGNAVFNGIVQFHPSRETLPGHYLVPAAEFDCTR